MREESKAPAEELAELARLVRERLAWWRESGYGGIAGERLEAARRRVVSRSGDWNPAEALREIRRELGDCRRCALAAGRTNLVFGEGDPYARLMFVGEAPGADEDAQGVPFVGKAGQLLTDIIEKGMKLKRSEVYIANVVKCRPPENRDPLPAEQETCLPFLRAQVAAIKPRVIVALGKVASRALLQTTVPVSRLRGTWSEYEGIPVMPTYHPAHLLRNPREKKMVWADIKKVMEKLGLTAEGKE